MKDPKYIGGGGAALSEQATSEIVAVHHHPRVPIDKPGRKIQKPQVAEGQHAKLDSIAETEKYYLGGGAESSVHVPSPISR